MVDIMTGYQSKREAARDKLLDDDDALTIAYQSGYYDGKKAAQPAQEPVAKYCCHVCFDKSGQTFLDRMILCSECGNKRCPKATNHALPCTNSNNPLQPAQEREALKLALKVLEDLPGFRADIDDAITAIKEALENNT